MRKSLPSGLVANSVVRDLPIKSSLTGSREDYGCDMKEVAATTTLRLERYPFCAALHWIVVAAGVFCSLNREILATATHPVRKCRIFLPKNSDFGRMRHVTRAPALESDAKTPVIRLRSSGQAMTSSCRQHFLYITLYSSRSANSTAGSAAQPCVLMRTSKSSFVMTPHVRRGNLRVDRDSLNTHE